MLQRTRANISNSVKTGGKWFTELSLALKMKAITRWYQRIKYEGGTNSAAAAQQGIGDDCIMTME